MFYAKAGHFGEKGWVKVSFGLWLKLWIGNYIVGIKIKEKIHEMPCFSCSFYND